MNRAGSRSATRSNSNPEPAWRWMISPPHGYVTIHTGQGARNQTDRYWNLRWYVWNNTGDTATLKDAGGRLLDRCSYKGTSKGYVFC